MRCPIPDYPTGMRYFFDKGREAIKYKVKDPVEYGGYINPLNRIYKVEDAVNRFETAYIRAEKAEKYERIGNTKSAIDEWKKIFGNYFPSYG